MEINSRLFLKVNVSYLENSEFCPLCCLQIPFILIIIMTWKFKSLPAFWQLAILLWSKGENGVRYAFITTPVSSLTFIIGPKGGKIELIGVYHWRFIGLYWWRVLEFKQWCEWSPQGLVATHVSGANHLSFSILSFLICKRGQLGALIQEQNWIR